MTDGERVRLRIRRLGPRPKVQPQFDPDDERSRRNLRALMEHALPHNSADAERFGNDLLEESDRACALLGGAWLEDGLSKLLRAYLVDDAAIVDELLGVDGALGTFRRRIDMAYALGLITQRQRFNFGIIRRIRNRAAHLRDGKKGSDAKHGWGREGFQSQEVASLCGELKLHKYLQISDDPRIRFTVVTSILLANLTAGAQAVKHVPVREHDGFTQQRTLK